MPEKGKKLRTWAVVIAVIGIVLELIAVVMLALREVHPAMALALMAVGMMMALLPIFTRRPE